ncbi:MAG: AI-2E family transporter [Planctomycetes bacterium]|nr:AI-2E family transporter [Planctomycetota bacterium]
MTELMHHERRVQTVCLLILAAGTIGVALYWLRPVMLPFVLAILFTLTLTALVDLQMHYLRLPRWLALLFTVLLGAVLAGALYTLVSASVTQLADSAGSYQEKLREMIEKFEAMLPVDPDVVVDPLSFVPEGTIQGMLLGTTKSIMDVLAQGVLVMVFVLFLLLGKEPHAKSRVRWEIEVKVKRYLATKMFTSSITGVLVGVTLWLLGIDLALVFGLFAFLLNFIPSLGSIIATLLPLPIVLVTKDLSPTSAILAIAIPGAIQFSMGNLIEPKIMGHSLDLHPIVVLMSLIIWGMIWGIIGMVLAAPITAVLKIMFERIDITRPVADLMAGHLPGTAPVPETET